MLGISCPRFLRANQLSRRTQISVECDLGTDLARSLYTLPTVPSPPPLPFPASAVPPPCSPRLVFVLIRIRLEIRVPRGSTPAGLTGRQGYELQAEPKTFDRKIALHIHRVIRFHTVSRHRRGSGVAPGARRFHAL